MRTAVIVSGVMRHMAEASSSWHFKNADYFLLVDNDVTAPQNRDSLGKATAMLHDVLENTKVKFTSVCIDNDTSKKFTDDNLIKYHQIEKHGMLNMAWKWKLAYQIVSTYSTQQPYGNVIILRPDLWLYPKLETCWEFFESLRSKDNELAGTSYIIPNPHDISKYAIMGDVFLTMNMHTLSKLAVFYDYFLLRYEDTLYNGYDMHSLLAEFMRVYGISVDNKLFEQMGFAVLRDNTKNMFDATGVILPEFNEYHLLEKQTEWWKQKYG